VFTSKKPKKQKTLEQFDFDFTVGVNRRQIEELSSMEFIKRKEKFISFKSSLADMNVVQPLLSLIYSSLNGVVSLQMIK